MLIDQLKASKRLPKRQGPDMTRTTLEDSVKVCADQNVTLPVFFAVQLHRLPPVDATHCDLSVILRELQAQRDKVCDCELADPREKVRQMKQSTSNTALLLHSNESQNEG